MIEKPALNPIQHIENSGQSNQTMMNQVDVPLLFVETSYLGFTATQAADDTKSTSIALGDMNRTEIVVSLLGMMVKVNACWST